MSRHIPNLLTLSNLFCGCCALIYALNGMTVVAAWFIFGCFLFDYADGMSARALGISSPLGKQLDSLADVISFGVVPAAFLYHMLRSGHCGALPEQPICPKALPAFVLTMFSAMRLGRFNIDTRQTTYFMGLSTPASTVFVLGLALSGYHNRFGLTQVLDNQWLIYALIALLSWLMNSEIPMFGMKIKSFDLRSNAFSLVFLAVFVALVFFLKELAFSAVIIFYIAVSLGFRNKVLAPP
ncbi:MAG: CDP-alcohol phosphatidyltransferase family protein [Saprospiraceae bacterium]